MATNITVEGFNGDCVAEAGNVLEALNAAGLSAEVSVRLNGAGIDPNEYANTQLNDGDTVVAAAPDLKGAR